MADPVSAGLKMAGQIVQGVAGYSAGLASKRAAYQSAKEAEQDAVDQETRIRENARKAIGGQIAAQGSNGFQMGTGSALDALMESQTNAVLDALVVRRRAASEARARRIEGDQAKKNGTFDLISGVFGAVETAAVAKQDWASAKSGQSGSYGGGG